jgi:hypothetical protein
VISLVDGDYFKDLVKARTGFGARTRAAFGERVALLSFNGVLAWYERSDTPLPAVLPTYRLILTVIEVLLEQLEADGIVLRHPIHGDLDAAGVRRHVAPVVAAHMLTITAARDTTVPVNLKPVFKLVILSVPFSSTDFSAWSDEQVQDLRVAVADMEATEDGRKVLDLLKTYQGGSFAALFQLEAEGFLPPELLLPSALSDWSREKITQQLAGECPDIDVLGLPSHELYTTKKYMRWWAEEGHEVRVNSSGQVCIAGKGLCLTVGGSYIDRLVAVRFRLHDLSLVIGLIPAAGSSAMKVLQHMRLLDMLAAGGKGALVAEFALCGPRSAHASHARYEAGVEATRAAYEAEEAGPPAAGAGAGSEEELDVGGCAPLASLPDFVSTRGRSGFPARGAASGAAALILAATLPPGAPPWAPLAPHAWVARLPAGASEAAHVAAAAAAAAAQAADAAAALQQQRVDAVERPVGALLAAGGALLAAHLAVAKRKRDDASDATAAAEAAPGDALAAAAAASAVAAAVAAQGAADGGRAVVAHNIKEARTHVAEQLLTGGGAPFVPMQMQAFAPPPPLLAPPPLALAPQGGAPEYKGVYANHGSFRAKLRVWGKFPWMPTRRTAAEAARDADVLYIMARYSEAPNFGRPAYPAELVHLPRPSLEASANADAKWNTLKAVVAAVAAWLPSPQPPLADAAPGAAPGIAAAVAALRAACPP